MILLTDLNNDNATYIYHREENARRVVYAWHNLVIVFVPSGGWVYNLIPTYASHFSVPRRRRREKFSIHYLIPLVDDDLRTTRLEILHIWMVVVQRDVPLPPSAAVNALTPACLARKGKAKEHLPQQKFQSQPPIVFPLLYKLLNSCSGLLLF